jgi:hypothetical protein
MPWHERIDSRLPAGDGDASGGDDRKLKLIAGGLRGSAVAM